MSKITASARNEPCLVRIPGICNWNPETTVLAHLNGAGWAIKSNDIHSAYCCSECHAWLDGGYVFGNENLFLLQRKNVRDFYHLQGMVKTQLILIEKELILLA